MTATLTEGTRCLACLGGPWVLSTITRVNDDGTYHVVPVGEEDSFMAVWEGVTPAELSTDDEARWPALFDRLRGARPGLGLDEVRATFAGMGIRADEAQLRGFFAERCAKVVPGAEVDGLVLDRDQAFQLFVGAGWCVRQLEADPAGDPGRELFKLYWNQVRMGGRDPAEVGRAITVDDARAAIGLGEAGEDPARAAALLRFAAREGLTLPATLAALWARAGLEEHLRDAHCNNPEPQPVEAWIARTGDADAAWGPRRAVRIMLPHQGDHAWWAVFADGDADAEVWLSFEEDGPPVRRVARSLPFFVWDLAETGRIWAQGKDADEET